MKFQKTRLWGLPLLLCWLWTSSSVGNAWAVPSPTQHSHHKFLTSRSNPIYNHHHHHHHRYSSRRFQSHVLDDESNSQKPSQEEPADPRQDVISSWIARLRGGGDGTNQNPLHRFAPPPWRALLAEGFGTFLIVFFGTGSVFTAVTTGAYANNLVSLATVWMIAVTMAIVCTAPISGAHLNPAMTWAFQLLRPNTTTPSSPQQKTPVSRWGLCLWYSLAQLVGAILGSLSNFGLYAHHLAKYEAQNQIIRRSPNFAMARATASCFGEYPSVPLWQAFVVEAVGTALLAAVVFAVTHPKQPSDDPASVPPPLLIGATVGALISVLAPLTQAGLNPARDFGPRIVAACVAGFHPTVAFRSAWVYILGPLVGAPLGGWFIDKVLYKTTTKGKDE